MELLDIYNDNGVKTGKVVNRDTKESEFNKGEHIAVSIIYIENNNNEFLVQCKSLQKGRGYTMTGGHVLHNEDPKDCIIREAKEELGIDISKDNIIDLGYIICDFPVRFIYYLKKNININDLVLQKDEVESVSFMSINEIKNNIDKGLFSKAHNEIINRIIEYKSNN